MNTNPSNVPYVHLKKIEHNHYHLHGLVHLLAGATISGHKRGEDQPVKENTGSEPPLYYQTYTYTLKANAGGTSEASYSELQWIELMDIPERCIGVRVYIAEAGKPTSKTTVIFQEADVLGGSTTS